MSDTASRTILTGRPSRFAKTRAAPARLILAVLAVALISLAILSLLPSPETSRDAAAIGDLGLYRLITGSVRGGTNYYVATADALRAGDYPLRPFLTFRLPTLTLVEAKLPTWAVVTLLSALVTAVAGAWGWRLLAAFKRPVPMVAAMILLAGGLAAFVQSDLIAFHEIWAGLLIALALAIRRPGRWVTAAAVGMIAMLIRETAIGLPLVMAVVAWTEGNKREAIGWAATIAVLAAVLAAHGWAVAQVVRPLDPASPGWLGFQGPAFALRAIGSATALRLFPPVMALPMAALGLFGWIGWRHPAALRTALVLIGYAAALALFARPDTFYWALLIAPLSLVGLIFVPDAIGDLVRAALDRRRVTVTRVTP